MEVNLWTLLSRFPFSLNTKVTLIVTVFTWPLTVPLCPPSFSPWGKPIIHRKTPDPLTRPLEYQQNHLTYHVCDLGSWLAFPHLSMANFWGPLLPYNSANPFIGTRDVPVTNCKRRALISLSNVDTACMVNREGLELAYSYDFFVWTYFRAPWMFKATWMRGTTSLRVI